LDRDVPIWLGTDSPEKINPNIRANIITIQEEFNYNLKRIPIAEGLKHHDTIWYCDTDIHFRNSREWHTLNETEIGIEPVAIFNEAQLGDDKGSTEYMREYIEWVKGQYPNPKLLLEYSFIVKTDNDKWIKEWERMDSETRGIQHQQYGLKGASEGLILWMSAMGVGLPVIQTQSPIWNTIVHSGQERHKGNRTLI